eukprot:322923_1
MTQKKEEFKQMNVFDELKVFGYIRMSQKSLPSNVNLFYIIPELIFYLIFDFYHQPFVFGPSLMGNIQIINNTNCKQVRCAKTWDFYAFVDDLRQIHAKKIHLMVKWTKCVRYFMIGWITSSLQQSVKNRAHCLGQGPNADNSFGIYISSHCTNFYLYGQDNKGGNSLDYSSPNKFKENDQFLLCWDLQHDIFTLHYNGTMAAKLSIQKYQSITPAFCMYYKDEEIEIVQ